ncbi:hypothetical protein [Massilia timonae]|uniref:hypothetical protein n=1 Tax=Massilia timonae TaxID=47229 RepID=UPI00116003C0|nr:hypothetical protein [Massilia timonae]
MEDFEYLWNKRCDVQLRALTNRLYYQERQKIFEWRDGIVKVISILAGSVAFGNVTHALVIQWCAAIVTISSAASLVFGFGNKARDSAKRSAEWALLEKSIEEQGERTFIEADLAKWTARCNEIEAGEPAAHPALFEECYQRACSSLGSKPNEPCPKFRWVPIRIIH